jgi:hypothetical protein
MPWTTVATAAVVSLVGEVQDKHRQMMNDTRLPQGLQNDLRPPRGLQNALAGPCKSCGAPYEGKWQCGWCLNLRG